MISTDPSVWIAAFFTITIMSYAFRYNPLFKFAERTFIAAVIGHSVVMGIDSLRQFGFNKIAQGSLLYIIPILMGLTLFTRYHPKYHWVSRYGMAALVGIGLGITLRATPKSDIVLQLVKAITLGSNPAMGILVAVTVFTVILYFTFTIKKVNEKPFTYLPTLGKYLMLVAFGAAFGNTVTTRMTLLVGRLLFLLRDFLGLIH
jgi:hypothetical protein